MKKRTAWLLTVLFLFISVPTVYAVTPEVTGSVSENRTASDIYYSLSFSAPAARDTELMRREAYAEISQQLSDAQIENNDELAFLLYPVEAVVEICFEDGSVYAIKSVNVTEEKAAFSLFGDILPALIRSGAYTDARRDGFDFVLSVRIAVNVNGQHSSGDELGKAALGSFSAPATSYIEYDLPFDADNKDNPVFLFYPFAEDILLKNPSRTGYTFTGWVSGGKAIDRIPAGTRYMKAGAGWRSKIFQVRCVLTTRTGYDFIKCRNPNPQEFSSDTGLELTDAQAPAGWVFRGWYPTPDFSGDPVTVIPAGTEKDVVLYAKWMTENEVTEEKIAAAKWGDLDSDGRITAADARKALRAAVGLDILEKEIIMRGDFAGQGKLTATTARHLLRIAVGLDSLKDVLKQYDLI